MIDIKESLKAIYKIQEVDLTKIRPFIEGGKEKKEGPIPSKQELIREEEMDLGPRFRLWVAPFFLENPVTILGLSKMVEKILLDNGFLKIKDLRDFERLRLQLTRVLGPTQLEELIRQAETLFSSRNVSKEFVIDYGSMLIQLVHSFDRKQLAFLWLNSALLSLIPLSPFEMAELKKGEYDRERKRRAQEELTRFLSKEAIQSEFRKMMEAIRFPFFVHWVSSRGGFVEAHEIKERLYRKALDENVALNVFSFFEQMTSKKMEETVGLVQEKGLFFANLFERDRFLENYKAIVPFFSYRNACYQVEELYRLLFSELSRKGEYLSFDQCKKILFSLKEFTFSKDKRGRIFISWEGYGFVEKNSHYRGIGANRL